MGQLPTRSSQPSASCWRKSPKPCCLYVAVLLLLLLAGDAVAAPASSQHWALFNTVCARCHEAQCSGRLSLGNGDMQSRAHVERYAGRLSDDLHQQLVVYLQYMKEFCGFTSIPLVFEPRAKWSQEQLTDFRTPNGEAYFVPLGELAAGKHRVQARLVGADWSAQVVAGDFDALAEARSCGGGDEFSLEFHAGEGMHYLRVMGRGTLQLQELRLAALPALPH